MAIPPSPMSTEKSEVAAAMAEDLLSPPLPPPPQIGDPERAKSCHQCRQMKTSRLSKCKNIRIGSKKKKSIPCSISFCDKCLLNRYGEKLDEVAEVEGWCCPKCRGICNCSVCMKKKGYQPTGLLVQTAKASGFSSVSEMLLHKGLEGLGAEKSAEDSSAYPAKSPPPSKELNRKLDKDSDSEDKVLNQECKRLSDENDNKEITCSEMETERPPKKLKHVHSETDARDVNSVDECKIDPEVKPSPNFLKGRKRVTRVIRECTDEYIDLPHGASLTTVAGIELPAEDVGQALQFLEFCSAFAKVLNINKGQPESILREISRGMGRRGTNSPLVQFHVKLISLIHKDAGKGSFLYSTKSGDGWLKDLGKCINESQCPLKEVPLDFLDQGTSEYDDLGLSEKLRILNFLCDEILGSEGVRSWIDKENEKFLERMKEAKEKALAAKEKEKYLIQQSKAVPPLTDGALVTVSEPGNIVSEIKSKPKDAEVKVLGSLKLMPNRKQASDAVRTESVLLDGLGRAFWRLKGYCNCEGIVRQDIANWDLVTTQDKWFIYDDEEEKVVEKHISFIRKLRLKRHRRLMTPALQTNIESAKDNNVPA